MTASKLNHNMPANYHLSLHYFSAITCTVRFLDAYRCACNLMESRIFGPQPTGLKSMVRSGSDVLRWK